LVVRPFSGYAADQALDYPFPSLIKRAYEHKDPLVVWGSTQTVRDWIHIDDVVEASLLFASHRLSITVNLCSGVATTFQTLAEMMSFQVGYSPVIHALPNAPSGVAYRVGNPTLMHSLGYVPKISLEEGVSRALFVANQM
jgi:nucleoside-diphosphate-sugar epimerase